MRRFFYITGAGLLLALVVALVLEASSAMKWIGYRSIEVHVVVIDATELTAIPDATIETLDGHQSPLESDRIDLNEFEIRDDGIWISDKRGRVRFTCRFKAFGSKSFFKDVGSVDTSDVWLRVTADGYRTTHIPMDRQSISPRRIEDDTPIVVTVPMGKIYLRILKAHN